MLGSLAIHEPLLINIGYQADRGRASGSSGCSTNSWPSTAARRTDNGPELIAQPFIDWCADHRVAIHDIQPGKPDQNAYIERFNRSYRTEVLNAHLLESIAERQALTITWLRIYNEERPHDSLGRPVSYRISR